MSRSLHSVQRRDVGRVLLDPALRRVRKDPPYVALSFVQLEHFVDQEQIGQQRAQVD